MGVLGYSSDELLDMTIRQFFNALIGHNDFEADKFKVQRELTFSAFRFNAQAISAGLSKKLSDKIANYTFDWEKDKNSFTNYKNGKKQPLNYDTMMGVLNTISKEE